MLENGLLRSSLSKLEEMLIDNRKGLVFGVFQFRTRFCFHLVPGLQGKSLYFVKYYYSNF